MNQEQFHDFFGNHKVFEMFKELAHYRSKYDDEFRKEKRDNNKELKDKFPDNWY